MQDRRTPPEPARILVAIRSGLRSILGRGRILLSSRRVRFGLAIVLALVIVLGLDSGRRAWQARGDILAGAGQFERGMALLTRHVDGKSMPSAGEYQQARQLIAEGHASLRSARSRLGYVEYLMRATWWVPRVGPQVAGVQESLATMDALASDATVVLEAASPLFGDERPQQAVRGILANRGEEMVSALRQIAAASPRVHRLAETTWDGPLRAAEAPLRRVDAQLARLTDLPDTVELARVAYPTLMGFNGDQRYLILGQNSEEIRPTGGFLGTVGLATVSDGRIQQSRYSRVTEWEQVGPPYIDFPVPPRGFMEYYGGDLWRTRDMNWYADFARSSRDIMAMVAKAKGERTDGVIAVNNGLVTRLLQVYGPLQLAEFADPVSADTWVRQVSLSIGESDRSLTRSKPDPRQFYLEPILKALLERLQSVPRDKLPATVSALRSAIAERELQVYSNNPDVEQLMRRMGASGELLAPARGTDFVGVVDTNLSETKVGPAIRRDITYLSRQDGQIDLVVRWTNIASSLDANAFPRINGQGVIFVPPRQWVKTPNVFGNFVRIYLPRPIRIGGWGGFDRPPGLEYEGDFAVFSGFVTVRDGSSAQIWLTYQPGGGEWSSVNGVRVWHQGGVTGELTVLSNREQGATTIQDTRYQGPFTTDVDIALR